MGTTDAGHACASFRSRSPRFAATRVSAPDQGSRLQAKLREVHRRAERSAGHLRHGPSVDATRAALQAGANALAKTLTAIEAIDAETARGIEADRRTAAPAAATLASATAVAATKAAAARANTSTFGVGKQRDEEDWMLREANRVQTNALQSAKELANDTTYTESLRTSWRPVRRLVVAAR